MNVILTINQKFEAMLIHDEQLKFKPAWVEFSRDGRGIRVISEEGREFKAGVVLQPELLEYLPKVTQVTLVWMKNGKPLEGHDAVFINQYYEGKKPAGDRHDRHASAY
jgi:hypothetical protein